MTIKHLQAFLNNATELQIELPNGTFVPAHFHITEIGLIQKHFIDCGGTVRQEKTASMQVWVANDTEHRLAPSKLVNIIRLAQPILVDDNLNIEVEYQQESISKFGLEIKENHLLLTSLFTNCLAKDHCGIPSEKMPKPLAELQPQNVSACCTPGGGCC